jgi:hypothetical protein
MPSIKSYVYWILIFCLFNPLDSYVYASNNDNEDQCFIVTAYYSPLEWQKKYNTWSYWWDIRLNWDWKHTASWKKVFTWLLAAPRSYEFWTKIYLEWLWVWEVEDRWWAIKSSSETWHECDRIDVWMWYWDEWLERALKWWIKEVKWRIVANDTEISIDFDESKNKEVKILSNNIEYEKIDRHNLIDKELKQKLDKINNKIYLFIKNKYWDDKEAAYNYKIKLKINIQKYINLSKDNEKIKMLKYLKETL